MINSAQAEATLRHHGLDAHVTLARAPQWGFADTRILLGGHDHQAAALTLADLLQSTQHVQPRIDLGTRTSWVTIQ